MHQSLSRLLGQQLEDSSHFWAPWFIIHHILERGLIFTDNVRRSPADTVPTAALHTPTDLASGENLGRYLLLKKNGSSADRKEFRRIGETFEQLTFGCHFDVGLREPARSRMPQSEEAAPGTLHLAITTQLPQTRGESSAAGSRTALEENLPALTASGLAGIEYRAGN